MPPSIILAGGFGTRIRHLAPDVPKPMIAVHGRPFIEWVIKHQADQGLREFVISTGYLAHKVSQHFAENPMPGLHVTCTEENEPLGTGGAIVLNLNSFSFVGEGEGSKNSPPVEGWQAKPDGVVSPSTQTAFVSNGDSILKFSVQSMLDALTEGVEGVILGLAQPDCSRFGKLDIDDHNNLKGFAEKSPGPGVINAGVYLLRTAPLLQAGYQGAFSIEREYFPARLAAGARYKVVTSQGPFIDIGTPESLADADNWVAQQEWLIG